MFFYRATKPALCVPADDEDINRMGEKVMLREQVKELFNRKYGGRNSGLWLEGLYSMGLYSMVLSPVRCRGLLTNDVPHYQLSVAVDVNEDCHETESPPCSEYRSVLF